MAAVEERHWWFAARRRIVETLLRRFRLPENCVILEAGCGTGGNLTMLARFGQVSAFEPDTDALHHAMQKTHVNLRLGHLPDAIPFAPASFDLIVTLDVLEHVEADEAALLALHRMLKPGGRILLTVPAYQWLWSTHDTIHHHKRRYTRSGLVRKMRGAGFTVSHAGYGNMLLFPLVALLRLAEHKGWRKGGADDAMPPRGLNGILYRLFAIERFWIGRVPMPFGVSVIAVGVKASD